MFEIRNPERLGGHVCFVAKPREIRAVCSRGRPDPARQSLRSGMHSSNSIGKTALVVVVVLATAPGCLMGRLWVPDHELDLAVTLRVGNEETQLLTNKVAHNTWTLVGRGVELRIEVAPGIDYITIANTGTDKLGINLDNTASIDHEGHAHPLAILEPEAFRIGGLLSIDDEARLGVWPRTQYFHMPDKANQPFGPGVAGSREEVLSRIRSDIGLSYQILLPIVSARGEQVYRLKFVVTALGARKVWYA